MVLTLRTKLIIAHLSFSSPVPAEMLNRRVMTSSIILVVMVGLLLLLIAVLLVSVLARESGWGTQAAAFYASDKTVLSFPLLACVRIFLKENLFLAVKPCESMKCNFGRCTYCRR